MTISRKKKSRKKLLSSRCHVGRKSAHEWMKDPLVDKIAHVSYTAMREWSIITRQPIASPWDELSEDYKDHMRMVVARSFVNMEVPTGKQLHDNCLKEALESGWTYAEKVNRKAKQHPDIRSWQALSIDQRIKEHIFSGIMKAFLEGT